MKIRYLDCRGKKKLFSLYTHDYRTWEDEEGNFYMIDGGSDYTRYSHPDMGELGIDVIKEDTIDSVIEDLREQFTWGKNYDKDGKRLPKTQFVPVKDLSNEHIINIIEHIYEKQITNSRSVFVMLAELRYRLQKNIVIKDENN